MKKSFVYEYENTPKRKFNEMLENFVNHALLFTFGGSLLSALVIVVIKLI
tara:strand:- start:391 stop:540 length:150 start_codon:yes stop_codon:yes gene_type:complete